MHAVGIVLHPQRDSKEAVDAILGWASRNGATVYGIGDEISRLNCAATAVTAEEMAKRAELIVSLPRTTAHGVPAPSRGPSLPA